MQITHSQSQKVLIYIFRTLQIKFCSIDRTRKKLLSLSFKLFQAQIKVYRLEIKFALFLIPKALLIKTKLAKLKHKAKLCEIKEVLYKKE